MPTFLTEPDNGAAQLRLACLGPPQVWLAEQPLTFPTRKALALLIYLALEGGAQPRLKLMALFWPDSDARRARSALRSTLAYLRRALDTVEPGASHNLLRPEGDTLALNEAADIALDVRAVTAATGPAALEKAIKLYRGDFLEGFSLPDAPDFDDWAAGQREYWHRMMSSRFDHLSQAQLDARHFAAAISTATLWSRHDPLAEAAYRRLMEAYALAGDRPAALQVYEGAKATLRLELGIDPSPETEQLRLAITTSQFAAAERKASGQPPQSADLPFVGRVAEHSRLASLFRQASSGHFQVVVLEGEAGIGKSRLAAEFLGGLALQGVEVLQGRAFEMGGRLPYQPLVESLRERLERENAPDDLLADVWLAELSRLLPELAERYPDLPAPSADEHLARTRLPEAITRLGQALAQRRPVAWLVDDLQWADEASLDVLHYASQAWASAGLPLLLLLTLRSEAVATTPHLENWLAHLSRAARLTQLPLKPLTAGETQELVARLPDIAAASRLDPPAAFGRWLFQETAGQPFFISEMLRALPDQLRNSAGQLPQGLLPPGVRQIILTRLKALPADGRALLTAASILGRPCPFELLCRITDLTETQALPALEESLNRRLLLDTGHPTRPYTFAHDKIRDVVYTEAGDARRRLYHRRAFEALREDQAPPAELAHHALAARLPQAAFHYSLAAGEAALQLFAVRDAIAHFEQARQQLSLFAEPEPTIHDQALMAKLYSQLARAYEVVEAPEKVALICQEMLAMARSAGWPQLEGAALNRLASLAIYRQQMASAAELLDQAQHVAETAGDAAGLAQTEWHLGQLAHHLNDFAASKAHCERALALARTLNDPHLIAGASNSLAYALFFLGQVEPASEVMEQARAGFAALGDRALEADSLVGLAGSHILSGRVEASIAAAQAALAIGQEIENGFGQAMSRAWLVFGLVDRGDYEEALSLARHNLEAARSQALAPKLVATFSAGLLYWALGDHATARTVHQELMPHLEVVAVPAYLEQIYAHLCVDAVLAGDWEIAHAYARQALARRDYQALPLFIAPHWPETAALLAGGDSELAREDVRRWGQLVGKVPRFRVGYLRALALLAEWEQDIDQAIVHLREALSLAEEMGLPGEVWQILAKLAALHRSAGQELPARQALGQAATIRSALGLTSLQGPD